MVKYKEIIVSALVTGALSFILMRESSRSDDYKHLQQMDDLRREKQAIIKASQKMDSIWATQLANIKAHREKTDSLLSKLDTTSNENKRLTNEIKSIVNDTEEYNISEEQWKIEYEILRRE